MFGDDGQLASELGRSGNRVNLQVLAAAPPQPSKRQWRQQVLSLAICSAFASAALLIAPAFGSNDEADAVVVVENEPEIATHAATIPAVAANVDSETVLELIDLLDHSATIASSHGLEFDDTLQTDLRLLSEVNGVRIPVAAGAANATSVNVPVATLFHADAGEALIADITDAAQSVIGTFLEAAPAPEHDLARRPALAAASRNQGRSQLPATADQVRTLAASLDNWVADEASATAAHAAAFRARMVAISRAHGNGRLPSEALCPIAFAPRFNMRCDVVDSLNDLNTAFRAHFGRDVVVRSGYRANPGTSNHGWGLAIDFGGQMVHFGTAEFNWMMANANLFGWGHASWARPGGINPQPWHWEAMSEVREMTGRWQ